MLEAQMHPSNVFVTLTYEDGSLPMSSRGLATLEPKHMQNWLKRLRKSVEPTRLRFYAVGEYGDESWRPHYHAALFNFPACIRGVTFRRPGSTRADWANCCSACHLVGETWGKGDVEVGVLEPSSAGYLAGYVSKKMTRSDDVRLNGRFPEFSRMSRKPGIGYEAVHNVAESVWRHRLLEEKLDDVPGSLRHGSREQPLGRYLTKALRKQCGRDENAPESVVRKYQEELQPVRQAAFDASQSFADALAQANAQKVKNFGARKNIYRQRKTL